MHCTYFVTSILLQIHTKINLLWASTSSISTHIHTCAGRHTVKQHPLCMQTCRGPLAVLKRSCIAVSQIGSSSSWLHGVWNPTQWIHSKKRCTETHPNDSVRELVGGQCPAGGKVRRKVWKEQTQDMKGKGSSVSAPWCFGGKFSHFFFYISSMHMASQKTNVDYFCFSSSSLLKGLAWF